MTPPAFAAIASNNNTIKVKVVRIDKQMELYQTSVAWASFPFELWVGQSIREVFARSRVAPACLLLFDNHN